jgi:hypothetical protein
MGTNRKAKLKKVLEKKRRQEARLRTVFDRILPLVGADELFSRLTEESKESIRRRQFPRPEIELGDDLIDAEHGDIVRAAASRTLDRFLFTTTSGLEISVQEFFQVVLSLRESIDQLRTESTGESFNHLIAQTRERAKAIVFDLIDRQLPHLLINIDMALAEFTRIDSSIYWYQSSYSRDGQGKGLFKVTLRKSPRDRVTIAVDGEPRPAFRCGASLGVQGIRWVDLPAGLLGVSDSGTYPLYVQSHAIKQLHDRVPISNEGFVHDAMWQSFADPKVVQNGKGQYLIEYGSFTSSSVTSSWNRSRARFWLGLSCS